MGEATWLRGGGVCHRRNTADVFCQQHDDDPLKMSIWHVLSLGLYVTNELLGMRYVCRAEANGKEVILNML